MTEAEFLEAGLWPFRSQHRRAVAVMVVSGSVLAALAWLGPGQRWYLFLGIFFILSGVLRPFLIRRNLRRFWSQNPLFSEHTRVVIGRGGYATESGGGRSLTYWHAFSHFQETPRLLLVFRGPLVPYSLPKRAFADEAQLQACLALLRDVVGNTKYSAGRGFLVTIPERTDS